jgi:hypothetical protein
MTVSVSYPLKLLSSVVIHARKVATTKMTTPAVAM